MGNGHVSRKKRTQSPSKRHSSLRRRRSESSGSAKRKNVRMPRSKSRRKSRSPPKRRQSRSDAKSASRRRSRSGKREWYAQPAPRTSAKPPASVQCPVDLNKAIIEDGAPLNSGEPTWQAAIFVPQGGTLPLNHSGRVRTMCIRGPPRASQEQAKLDAKQLNEATPNGPAAVRAASNHMVHMRVRTMNRL